MAKSDGDPFVDGDILSYQEMNRILTSFWQASEPSNLQSGSLYGKSTDEKLFLMGTAASEEVLQASRSCDIIPDFLGVDFYDACGGAYSRIKEVDEPGLGSRLTIGMDETARTMIICDLGDIDVDFGLAARVHPTLYVKSASNADHLFMYHNDANAYLRWNDGSLIFQTDEGINSQTTIQIRPKGTLNETSLELYDSDSMELWFGAHNNWANINAGTSHSLYLQYANVGNILCFSGIPSGNPYFRLYGYITQGAATRYTQMQMEDTNNEFVISAEDNVNHEGITISLLEVNQKFRVRGVASALGFYVKSDGEIGTNQTVAGTTLGNVTDKLPIYDENQALVGYIPIYDAIT